MNKLNTHAKLPITNYKFVFKPRVKYKPLRFIHTDGRLPWWINLILPWHITATKGTATLNNDGPDNYRFQKSHVSRPLPVSNNATSIIKSVVIIGILI